MTQIVWAPLARQDLKAIYVSIARYNVPAALKAVQVIRDKISLLARHPRVGVQRDDLYAGLRMTTVPPYLVFYELVADGSRQAEQVKLLRILDGRRDLAELL